MNTRNYSSNGQSPERFSSAKLSCSRVALKRCIRTEIRLLLLLLLTTVLNSHGMKKITLCNTKKYKNQAGMNLTPPPPPSQNSHAVRWHSAVLLLFFMYLFYYY